MEIQRKSLLSLCMILSCFLIFASSSYAQLNDSIYHFQDGVICDSTSGPPSAVITPPAKIKTSIQVFPNPAHDEFRINLEGYQGPISIILSNTDGRILDQRVLNSKKHHNWFRLSGLDRGVYIVQVRSGYKNSTVKLVVH